MLIPSSLEKRLSQRAQKILENAKIIAQNSNASEIQPRHLILSLLKTPGTFAFNAFKNHGIEVNDFKFESSVKNAPLVPFKNRSEEAKLSLELSGLLKKAMVQAANFNHNYIGTEHLLLVFLPDLENLIDPTKKSEVEKITAYLKETLASSPALVHPRNSALRPGPDFGNLNQNLFRGLFPGLPKFLSNLFNQNINPWVNPSSPLQRPSEKMPPEEKPEEMEEFIWEENAEPWTAQNPNTAQQNKSFLDLFAQELVAEAKIGKLDPVIGRQKEIGRLINILTRRTKNNPVLIGEPGVGKTALVQGLAQRIASNQTPHQLASKKIYQLDLGLIIAGTMFRGEFESRLKEITKEAKEEGAILFIDELHTIIGAGSAQGSLDAANIIKPMIAGQGLQIIGATTTGEYKKHIEKDAALERRFQSIMVREPSEEESVKIIIGLKPHYEKYHHVAITDQAVERAVSLAARFIGDRFLPDKAIDILDETCAAKKYQNQPVNWQIQINPASRLKNKIAGLAKEKKEAIMANLYEKALEIKNQEAIILEKIKISENQENAEKFKIKILPEDIERTLASLTGIPIEKLKGKELIQFRNLEKNLKQKIIGQNEAIKTISQTLKRSRAGLSAFSRPQGSFLFLGPTGVGKTELAKVLSRELAPNQSDDALIRIDMSEFMEGHSVSRLIGSPPGYIGFEEGGWLTEKVRRSPYSVILFDEIEKAHPQVLNILLQILEDGVLTDGHGRKINFKNSIIILTSNIGTQEFTRESRKFGFIENKMKTLKEKFEEIKNSSLKELKRRLRPELLSRIDHIIVFNPLNAEAIKKIVRLQAQDLVKRAAQNNIRIKIEGSLYNFIAKKSFEPAQGARLIRQILVNEIENALAEYLINSNRSQAAVAVKNGRVAIR